MQPRLKILNGIFKYLRQNLKFCLFSRKHVNKIKIENWLYEFVNVLSVFKSNLPHLLLKLFLLCFLSFFDLKFNHTLIILISFKLIHLFELDFCFIIWFTTFSITLARIIVTTSLIISQCIKTIFFLLTITRFNTIYTIKTTCSIFFYIFLFLFMSITSKIIIKKLI